jgi:hypothetical protein
MVGRAYPLKRVAESSLCDDPNREIGQFVVVWQRDELLLALLQLKAVQVGIG